jgi:hypothetical protein
MLQTLSPRGQSPSRLYLCHWGHIDGPRVDDRATPMTVWICEYPYRTIRLDGPDAGCAGCPLWDERPRRA